MKEALDRASTELRPAGVAVMGRQYRDVVRGAATLRNRQLTAETLKFLINCKQLFIGNVSGRHSLVRPSCGASTNVFILGLLLTRPTNVHRSCQAIVPGFCSKLLRTDPELLRRPLILLGVY
jgi:hypothetical protein